MYEVSALVQLNNSGNGDDWTQFTQDLSELANKSGHDITRSAAERGMRRFSASLRRSLEERLRALHEPIANSEQRIANLRQTVSQAEQSLRDLGALFCAEQMRLSNTLLARHKEFLRQVIPVAREEFQQEHPTVTTAFGPARRRELMTRGQVVARRHVMPWLDAEEKKTQELYNAVTQRFVNLVNGLLQHISQEQSSDFSHLPKSLEADQGFRTRSTFYFHDMIAIARPASPLLYCTDVVMGALRVGWWFNRTQRIFWNCCSIPMLRAFRVTSNNEWWTAGCVSNRMFADCFAR